MSASPAVRRTGRSALRRYSWLTLAVTLVASAALLTGDLWLTRAGAVIAFVGGLVSTMLAWREVKLQRTSYELRSTLDLRAHGEKLHTEREQHTRLLRILSKRNEILRSRAITARAEAGRLGQEVARLRGDNVSLRMDVATLTQENAGLQREVARLNEVQNAEILALPRRVSGPVGAGEEILWSEENQPTVVDLKAITAPFVDEAKRTLA